MITVKEIESTVKKLNRKLAVAAPGDAPDLAMALSYTMDALGKLTVLQGGPCPDCGEHHFDATDEQVN